MAAKKLQGVPASQPPAVVARRRKTAADGFPIVGIGASAGGLEAFEAFFRQAPVGSGMAFVLVPHLDPSHASILTEILQRTTAMPVVEALDQVAVEPNCVYVIPPNRDMAIFHRVLQLSVPDMPRGQRIAGGDRYLLRIQPYRTLDNVIEGAVLTFTDISKRAEAEAAAREARELAEGIVDTVREPLIVLDGNLQAIFASRSFYRQFQVTPEDTVGHPIYALGNGQWDIPALRKLLEDILPREQAFEGYLVEHDFPAIGRRRMLLNARRIVGKTGGAPLILLAMEDAT